MTMPRPNGQRLASTKVSAPRAKWRRWTDDDRAEVARRFAELESDADIASAIGRSQAAVQVQRVKQRLVRANAADIAEARRRHLDALREARATDPAVTLAEVPFPYDDEPVVEQSGMAEFERRLAAARRLGTEIARAA